MARADSNRIDGWRDIAAYLARDERTAKRWEKQRGLPVRRIPGEGRANVYVLRSEVEAWLERGRTAVERDAAKADDVPVQRGAAEEPEPAAEEVVAPTDEAVSPLDAEPEVPAVGLMVAPGSGTFRPSQHVSLMVSLFGLLLLLTASAVRFFHLGPLEKILFASESLQPEQGSKTAASGEADRLYLQGVYLTEQRTPESLERARKTFDEAIALEPDYALNYGGLAITYLLLREYGTMPDDEAYSKAQAAAEQALVRDPNQAEAHAAMGFIDFFHLWKAAEGEREFGRAMTLDPSSALAHHWYGSMLTHQGRYAEALAQLDQAQRLNPTSAAILASKALAIGFSGRKEEALRLLHVIDGMGGSAAMAHRNLAVLSMMAPRQPAVFLEEGIQFAELRHDAAGVERLQAAAAALHRSGEMAMWASMLGQERLTHPDAEHPTYLMAKAEAALGQEDAAIDALSRLVLARDGQMMGIVMDPAFDRLRKDAKFVRIAEQVGLLYPAVAAR